MVFIDFDQTMAVAIIAFIIALLILVVAHEWGHYILAKFAGVKVYEFAAGMGKKVLTLGKDKSGTVFNLRIFPIGGFVRIKGESLQEEGALTAKDSFLCAPFRWKVAILLGGIVMNIIVAWVFFVIAFWHGVKPIQVLPDNVTKTQSQSYLLPSYSFLEQEGLITRSSTSEPAHITNLVPNGLGAAMGMQADDTIVSINETQVSNTTIQKTLQGNIGQEIRVVVSRGGVEQTLTATCPQDECLLGVLLEVGTPAEVSVVKFPLSRAIVVGGHEVVAQATMTWNGLRNMFAKLFSGQ